MKPMIFSSDKAFQELDETGSVVSFRANDNHSVGEEVWIRRSRNGEKEFNAEIKAKIETHPQEENLAPYWDKSGFDSLQDWLQKIRDYTEDESLGQLYKVVKRE